MGVDNPGGRRQVPEWARRDDLDEHRSNPYAHGELVGRLQQEGLNVRERFENRLVKLEEAVPQKAEERLSVLERFRAQATLLGGLGLLVLGAVVTTLAYRVFH